MFDNDFETESSAAEVTDLGESAVQVRFVGDEETSTRLT